MVGEMLKKIHRGGWKVMSRVRTLIGHSRYELHFKTFVDLMLKKILFILIIYARVQCAEYTSVIYVLGHKHTLVMSQKELGKINKTSSIKLSSAKHPLSTD